MRQDADVSGDCHLLAMSDTGSDTEWVRRQPCDQDDRPHKELSSYGDILPPGQFCPPQVVVGIGSSHDPPPSDKVIPGD
jgi:hypothetical protein